MSSIIAAIYTSAKLAQVPGALLLAICTHESNLTNVVVPHDGNSASIGVCQIKESTARSVGYRGKAYLNKLKPSKVFGNSKEPIGTPTGLLDVSINSYFAALYLRKQLERYDYDWCKATASYNSGTYRPSTISPGKPRNYKYVKKVVLNLDPEHRDYLVCGARRVYE